MLKVPDQAPHKPDRSFGELFHQLLEDGKAYARAEVGLAKAIANAKVSALVLPAGLLIAALVVGFAAINALAVGVVMALARFVGPLLAGVIGLILFAAIAGGLAWVAVARAKREL